MYRGVGQPQEQDFCRDGMEAGRQKGAEGTDIARGDLGEQRLTRRDEAAGCLSHAATQAHAVGGRLHLDAHLPPAGQATPKDKHAALLPIRVHGQVLPVPGGAGDSRMVERDLLAEKIQTLVGLLRSGSRQDDIKHPGCGAEMVTQPNEKPGPHGSAQVSGRKLSQDPVRVHIRRDDVVGCKSDHGIRRSRRSAEHADGSVSRREDAARRLPKDRRQGV